MLLEFNQPAHAYRLDGKPVPSVTQALGVLESYLGIPESVLEAARQRGELVHQGCDQIDREVFDADAWQAVLPELAPWFEGYRNWLADSGATILSSESRVGSPKYGYAGTLDAVAEIRGRLVLIDRKATAAIPPTVGPQTAAYLQAYQETYPGKATGQRFARYCLHLNPSHARGYKFAPLNDPADWSVFVSCLNVKKWKDKHAA